jgi:hypothetical protein
MTTQTTDAEIRNASPYWQYVYLDTPGFSAETGLRTEADIDRANREGRNRDDQTVRNGGAIIDWHDGYLRIRTRRGTKLYRGGAVEGRDADDPFVQHLAAEAIAGNA